MQVLRGTARALRRVEAIIPLHAFRSFQVDTLPFSFTPPETGLCAIPRGRNPS